MDERRMTNREVEDAALAAVLAHERGAGRADAHDTRGRGAAADVVSGGRTIEVKAFGGSARGGELWLEPRQTEEATGNPDFWLYVVEHVRQGPEATTVLEIGGDDLAGLLERKREQRYFTVPFPVGEYDRLHDR